MTTQRSWNWERLEAADQALNELKDAVDRAGEIIEHHYAQAAIEQLRITIRKAKERAEKEATWTD